MEASIREAFENHRDAIEALMLVAEVQKKENEDLIKTVNILIEQLVMVKQENLILGEWALKINTLLSNVASTAKNINHIELTFEE